nr:DUF1850 domain-containing protein [Neobacillus sp. Marseille-Q6967]
MKSRRFPETRRSFQNDVEVATHLNNRQKNSYIMNAKKQGMKYVLRKTVLYLILFVSITFIYALIPQQQAIVFQSNDNPSNYIYIPTKKESFFKIKYTHSIHLTDVVETYKITKKQTIQQVELMYEDFAIGMPANAGEGETFEQENGKYYIKNMKRIFPSFHLRIGQVRANHRVIYQNKEYPLSRYIRPGTSVKVEIRNLNYFQQRKGVNILESL